MTKTTLKFNEKAHRYWLDGRPIPGVTTLLGKGLPKPALVYWSAKMVAEYVINNPDGVEQLRSMGEGPAVAALKQVPWQRRDEAAIRGTDIHALAEDIAHGKEVHVPEHLIDPVDGYVRWLDAWQPKPLWTERPIANRRWWYAGKPDIVCEMVGDTWLLDWKSASGVYGDNAAQVAAYRNAEFYVTEDGTEEPMPPITRLGVVHITPTGTQLYEVNDPDAAWKDFLHIQWVANAEDRIKNYLGEPLPDPETAA